MKEIIRRTVHLFFILLLFSALAKLVKSTEDAIVWFFTGWAFALYFLKLLLNAINDYMNDYHD